MSLEVKRVPLDFSWPLGKMWDGYVNPHDAACPSCGGDGVTVSGRRLSDIVNLLMLSGDDAVGGREHPYFAGVSWIRSTVAACGQEMIDLTTGLAGRAPSRLGHDAIDHMRACDAIKKAAGMDENWGQCPVCQGSGQDPATVEAAAAWTPTDPPAGEGYQIWETVSDGSPISPVHPTPELLAQDMTARGWAGKTYSYDAWMRLIQVGWAPSAALFDDDFRTGPEALLDDQVE